MATVTTTPLHAKLSELLRQTFELEHENLALETLWRQAPPACKTTQVVFQKEPELPADTPPAPVEDVPATPGIHEVKIFRSRDVLGLVPKPKIAPKGGLWKPSALAGGVRADADPRGREPPAAPPAAKGNVVGLGVLLERRSNVAVGRLGLSVIPQTRFEPVIVTEVVPGFAAHRSGALEVGDEIVVISDTRADGLTIENIKNLTRGVVGTECILQVRRRGATKLTEVHLTRIEPPVDAHNKHAHASLSPLERIERLKSWGQDTSPEVVNPQVVPIGKDPSRPLPVTSWDDSGKEYRMLPHVYNAQ